MLRDDDNVEIGVRDEDDAESCSCGDTCDCPKLGIALSVGTAGSSILAAAAYGVTQLVQLGDTDGSVIFTLAVFCTTFPFITAGAQSLYESNRLAFWRRSSCCAANPEKKPLFSDPDGRDYARSNYNSIYLSKA